MWDFFFILWLIFLSCIFWPPRVKKVEFWPFLELFWPFWRTSYWNGKMNKTKSVATFLIFSKEGLHHDQKLTKKHTKKNEKKVTKVACTFSRNVCARSHVHAHKHYKSTQETNPDICWNFYEDLTSFGWDIEVCYLGKQIWDKRRQKDKQTNRHSSNLF